MNQGSRMYTTWFMWALVATASALSQPPIITKQPESENVYYKEYETVNMTCEGFGEPFPSFWWQRNEEKFDPGGNDYRFVQLPNKGTLVANKPEDKDEGQFQCFAENEFGLAAGIKINLRQLKLLPFASARPTTHQPQLGKPYTLPCVPPESVPRPDVVWITKGELGTFNILNYDARVSMDREYRLRITNVKREDRNNGFPYACMAMNTRMRSNSQGPLHYIEPQGTSEEYQAVDYLWSDQNDRFGLRGETFTVKCIFSGNPTPDVHWERTGNRSLPRRASTNSFGQELVITNLQYEDEGIYECWATNSISPRREFRTFNVRVSSKPFFVEEPQFQEVDVGEDVEFTCNAQGSPPPKIDWFINGVVLADVEDERIRDPNKFNHPIPTKIFFTNVQKTDNLCIQCNASNIHGYVYSNVYLSVLSEAPTIIRPPSAKTVAAETRPVNISCLTTGKPDPIITWFKNDEQITGGRYREMDGQLYIESAVLSDAGHYRCQAKNKYNETSAEGVLVVRRKTRIEQKPLDLEVKALTDAKFTCSGTTDPEEVENLEIKWLKDGKEITTTDQRMTTNIQDNSLTISGTITRDSGTYTCIATNGLDEDRASAVLVVKDRPDAPMGVYHEFCDKNATIHWMPGSYNNAPVQYFVLQYNTSFNPDQWTFGLKVNSTLTKVNMTLSPYVNYTFRVIAFNKIGESDPSFASPVVCSTKPDRPFYHPRNLRTLGHQPGKLYIEWTPIPQIQQNAKGFHYILRVLRVGAQAETETFSTPISEWNTDHYEISTGRVYEPYRITLIAVNSIGEASDDPSTIIGYSAEGAPRIAPTDVEIMEVEDTYAKVKFNFDKREINKTGTKIQGEFKGFKIQFWEENREETMREHDVGPESAFNTTGNTFTAEVNDLLPNTNMMMKISVMNNFYTGPTTEPIRFRTLPGYPGVVDFVRVINIGDTHVNLLWGSPVENRGDLVGYDISYRLVNGLDLGEMQEREPQINDPFTSNAYLSGLSPSSKYRVYVYARTSKGRGEGYFIEIVTAKPGTPNMPRFTIPDVSSTSINVSWWINAFTSSGTIIYVEYRKLDGPEWLRTTDEVIHTWKQIDNLEPGTTYEVRIKATNGKTSVASGIDEVTTDGTAKAFALVGNYGWFIGMVLAMLLVIALIIAFCVCYRMGFRFTPKETHSGYHDQSYSDTAQVAQGSEHFGGEPRGYNNDYYDGRDYHDYDDGDGGFENRPPSYHSDDRNSDREKSYPYPANDEYEEYNRRPSDNYDRDYREPNKFDKSGAPREHYQDDYRRDDDYYDRRNDDYYKGNDYGRNDSYDRHDPRDSYDRRDDGHYSRDSYDRRDDGHYSRDSYDRRDYDDEPRRPSAPPSVSSSANGKPSSSTVV